MDFSIDSNLFKIQTPATEQQSYTLSKLRRLKNRSAGSSKSLRNGVGHSLSQQQFYQSPESRRNNQLTFENSRTPTDAIRDNYSNQLEDRNGTQKDKKQTERNYNWDFQSNIAKNANFRERKDVFKQEKYGQLHQDLKNGRNGREQCQSGIGSRIIGNASKAKLGTSRSLGKPLSRICTQGQSSVRFRQNNLENSICAIDFIENIYNQMQSVQSNVLGSRTAKKSSIMGESKISQNSASLIFQSTSKTKTKVPAIKAAFNNQGSAMVGQGNGRTMKKIQEIVIEEDQHADQNDNQNHTKTTKNFPLQKGNEKPYVLPYSRQQTKQSKRQKITSTYLTNFSQIDRLPAEPSPNKPLQFHSLLISNVENNTNKIKSAMPTQQQDSCVLTQDSFENSAYSAKLPQLHFPQTSPGDSSDISIANSLFEEQKVNNTLPRNLNLTKRSNNSECSFQEVRTAKTSTESTVYKLIKNQKRFSNQYSDKCTSNQYADEEFHLKYKYRNQSDFNIEGEVHHNPQMSKRLSPSNPKIPIKIKSVKNLQLTQLSTLLKKNEDRIRSTNNKNTNQHPLENFEMRVSDQILNLVKREQLEDYIKLDPLQLEAGDKEKNSNGYKLLKIMEKNQIKITVKRTLIASEQKSQNSSQLQYQIKLSTHQNPNSPYSGTLFQVYRTQVQLQSLRSMLWKFYPSTMLPFLQEPPLSMQFGFLSQSPKLQTHTLNIGFFLNRLLKISSINQSPILTNFLTIKSQSQLGSFFERLQETMLPLGIENVVFRQNLNKDFPKFQDKFIKVELNSDMLFHEAKVTTFRKEVRNWLESQIQLEKQLVQIRQQQLSIFKKLKQNSQILLKTVRQYNQTVPFQSKILCEIEPTLQKKLFSVLLKKYSKQIQHLNATIKNFSEDLLPFLNYQRNNIDCHKQMKGVKNVMIEKLLQIEKAVLEGTGRIPEETLGTSGGQHRSRREYSMSKNTSHTETDGGLTYKSKYLMKEYAKYKISAIQPSPNYQVLKYQAGYFLKRYSQQTQRIVADLLVTIVQASEVQTA